MVEGAESEIFLLTNGNKTCSQPTVMNCKSHVSLDEVQTGGRHVIIHVVRVLESTTIITS